MTEVVESAPQPAPQPESPVDDGVIRLGGPAEKPEMRPLFAIDGVTYKVPTKIRPNVALAIMGKFEEAGAMAAEVFMLRKILGPAAFDALVNYDGLRPEDMQAITKKLTELTFSSLEDESGN